MPKQTNQLRYYLGHLTSIRDAISLRIRFDKEASRGAQPGKCARFLESAISGCGGVYLVGYWEVLVLGLWFELCSQYGWGLPGLL